VTNRRPGLADLVAEFGRDISERVRDVLGHEKPHLRADLMAPRFVVRSVGDGIPLSADGRPLLQLEVNYECEWDAPETYLAVKRSAFTVHAVSSREPLFRYEWFKDTSDSVPCAHLQIHAHRDALTHAMYLGGRRGRRSKARTRDDKAHSLAGVSALHFPLGGPRMRPALEDVLEMLIQEFGIDAAHDWQEQLARGREDWRRKQVSASVRDAPQDAASTLRELGYTVTAPDEIPEGSPGILRRF